MAQTLGFSRFVPKTIDSSNETIQTSSPLALFYDEQERCYDELGRCYDEPGRCYDELGRFYDECV